MPYDNNAPRYNSNPRSGQRYGAPRSGGFQRKSSNDSQTDGIIMYNERVGKFLKTRFWNKTMGIDIGTFAPGTQVAYDTVRNAQTFGHVFSFSTLFELHEICEEVLESLKATGKFESMATEAGQKKDVIVEISNGSNVGMAPGIYLVIYKSVDAGKRTNIMDLYPFGSTKVLKGYDHNTGSATEDIRPSGDFKKFTMALKEAAKAFTMAAAHAAVEANKLDKMATVTALAAISASLGIDINKAVESARTTGQSSYQRGGRPQQGQGGAPQQFQRRSTPGQFNGGGYAGRQNGGTVDYQQQQMAMAAVNDEPVDINLDAATLQNVSISDFK